MVTMSETITPLIEVPTVARGAPMLTVVVPCYNERPNVAPLIARLDAALYGIAWEVVYVDDDSPDGTTAEVRRIAQADPRVRCIRRVGRRGLASAVIEGALSSSAQYVAVIDGDLQHDETKLPDMLAALRGGQYDLAVGSRHIAGGDAAGLASRWRHILSDGGIRLAQLFLPVKLTDPMSGYFMLPRSLFETLAPNLTGQGFKILLDLALSSPAPLRLIEIPCVFHERVAGESKLDALVLVQFAGLLLDKVFGGLLPLRFISFALVGALGVLVHLAVLTGLTCFTDFRVRTTPDAAWQRHFPPMPAGTLVRWGLSPAYDALARNLERAPSAAEIATIRWQEVEAEPPGLVVINRYR